MLEQAGGEGIDEILARAGSPGEVFLGTRRVLERLAGERPVVLVFDDVHWAEPTLLDLVEYLAARAEGPILCLCLARPELLDARPALGDGAIRLGPLGELQAGKACRRSRAGAPGASCRGRRRQPALPRAADRLRRRRRRAGQRCRRRWRP